MAKYLEKRSEDVPCFVLYDLPNGQSQVVVVFSDAQGVVTFITPICTVAGQASFQFEAEQLASNQILLDYQQPDQGNKLTAK